MVRIAEPQQQRRRTVVAFATRGKPLPQGGAYRFRRRKSRCRFCRWRLVEPRGPQPPAAEARSLRFAALRRLRPVRLRGGFYQSLANTAVRKVVFGFCASDSRSLAAFRRVYRSVPTPNPSLRGGAYRRLLRRRSRCQMFLKRGVPPRTNPHRDRGVRLRGGFYYLSGA